MANYLSDRELYYEIVLSKGMGKLTRKAEQMFQLIAENMIRKLEKRYKNEEKFDCMQHGLMHMFANWKSFNEKKFNTAFPYFSEIFKRGSTDGFNIVNNRRTYDKDTIRTISLESSNDGRGLHNI